MGLALKSLAKGTAMLPDVAPARPRAALGNNTIRALHSGVYFGTIGAVNEVVGRIGREMGKDLAIFVTGGDCELVAPDAPKEWVIAPALTVEGLTRAYEESL
jgi:type III pantothenate kinase